MGGERFRRAQEKGGAEPGGAAEGPKEGAGFATC